MSHPLPAALVDRVIARYPLPVADAVSALVSADSLHEERDRVVEVFRVVVRLLAVLALAARGQYGWSESVEGAEVGELLGLLRRRGLTDGQWVALLREILRPLPAARHPLPGLVRLVQRGRFLRLVDGLLEMRKTETVAHGATGDDEHLEALLVRRVPQLAELLEELGEAWEGLRLVAPLGAPEGEGRQRARLLMGCTPPRGRWRRVELQGGVALPAGEPVLVDGQGKPVLGLSPLGLVRRASAEAYEEFFALDRPGRRGAVYVGLPSMAEHVDAGAWGALERLLFEREQGEDEEGAARPYRGLESFGPEHAAMFFGREEQAEALAGRLRRASMLTVTGPSGSGKTSLLRAGVAPRMAGSVLVEVRPGTDPCVSLARKLAQLVAEDGNIEAITSVVRRRPEAAGQALLRWCVARSKQLLVLVDQAEELFTLCGDPGARAAFAQALVASSSDAAGPVRVVLVVREDYFARLATIEPLRGWYSRAVEVITTPDRQALVRTVVMPARRFGYSFDEPSLVERMVDAAAGEPAALGLLQFCADRLWEARDRRWKRITVEAYEALGGVEGALAAHAEKTLRDLTPSQQEAARRVLLRLVNAEGSRAPCSQSELLSATVDVRDAHVVLERLVEARLVVAREAGSGERDASLELVHEALLRHWDRLKNWLEQDREGQRRLDSLRRATREWDAHGQPRGLLWRNEVLAEHRLWRRRTRPPLTDLEEAFLDACEKEEARAVRPLRLLAMAGIWVLVLFVFGLASQWDEAVKAKRAAEDARGRAEEDRQKAELAREETALALMQTRIGQLVAEAGRRESLGRPGEAIALLRAAASLTSPVPEVLAAELRRLASLGEASLTLVAGEAPVLSLAYSPDGQRLFAVSGAQVRAWALDSQQPLTLAHQDTIWSVATSPDGRWVATASADRTAVLWRADTGEQVFSWAHAASVQSLAFSPDSRRLVTGSADGAVRVFSVPEGAALRSFEGHHQPVTTLAFSPDGARIAAGGRDRIASLWPLDGGAKPLTLGPFDDSVTQVTFSPDGASLAVLHRRTVEFFAPSTGKRLASLAGHEHPIHALAFAPGGERVVTASSDRTARLWDARTGKALAVLAGHERAVLRAVFSPDGERLATASMDGVVRVWDGRSGALLRALRGSQGGVTSLAFSPDGARLAAGSRADDGVVRVWETDGGARAIPLRGHADDLFSLAFSPDGATLATCSKDRSVILWSARTGAALHHLDHREPVYAAAFSPDGASLATASYDRFARVWSVSSGKLLHSLGDHEGYVPALSFSRDGRRLGTASVDRKVRLYDASSGALLRTLGGHDGAVFGLAFDADARHIASLSDDGRVLFSDLTAAGAEASSLPVAVGYAEATAAAAGRLAFGSSDGSATVWDVARGAVVRAVRGHQAAVLAVALSRDGALLATGSSDQRALLFRLDTGEPVAALVGHSGAVLSLAFSPDGRLLATGSHDRTVRLWNTSSGQLLGVFAGHDDKISALAFSPDGRLLASASHDDTARLWPVDARIEPLNPSLDLGARTNLRVCRDRVEVVAVLPSPPPDSVWAPAGACGK